MNRTYAVLNSIYMNCELVAWGKILTIQWRNPTIPDRVIKINTIEL